MTPAEAANLVERIVQTWPTGPRGRIWTEALTTLDAGTAGTTYIRLRDELEHAPSIAKFIAVYRSLRTPANDPLPVDCEWCDGCGWIRSEPDARGYTTVTPCRCPAGDQSRVIQAKIDDHRRRHHQGPYARDHAPADEPRLADLDLFQDT